MATTTNPGQCGPSSSPVLVLSPSVPSVSNQTAPCRLLVCKPRMQSVRKASLSLQMEAVALDFNSRCGLFGGLNWVQNCLATSSLVCSNPLKVPHLSVTQPSFLFWVLKVWSASLVPNVPMSMERPASGTDLTLNQPQETQRLSSYNPQNHPQS